LLVQPDFVKFIIQRIGFSQKVWITKLANQTCGPRERAFFVILVVWFRYWKPSELYGPRNSCCIDKAAISKPIKSLER
jgi:hypothetical protein